MTRKQFARLLTITVLPIAFSTAMAGQEVARIAVTNVPAGTTALGGGFRLGNNPYISSGESDEVPLDLVPLYLYEGKFLFAHGTSLGVHLINNDRFSLSALARWRFQQLDPSTDPIFDGLDRRHQTLDAGFAASVKSRFGELTLEGVTDTLNHHKGQELELSYRYNFERGSWLFSPFVSWGWQSDNLANYYFGVSESEATPERPAYEPGEAQFVTFGLNTSWILTDRIMLFGNLGFGGLDKAIEDSPIVDDPGFTAGFIGGTYVFGNTLKPVAGDDRISEWSWRLNYGYQAEENIIGGIDQGGFEKSSHADTNIGGVTFSRLLTDGKRIDYLGKFAVYRHFEKGVTTTNGMFTSDSDFWSYNAYVMVMGKGYSPWSGEEVFRLGFGFGMSYADQVPLAEQSKQAEKGSNTSQFLNYLELQLDFPLRRLFKSKAMQNCYAGVTVVHRSGIFGTSNLLGDVSGGADWITAHFECVRR